MIWGWLDITPRTWCLNGLRLSLSFIAVGTLGFLRRRVLVLSMLYKSGCRFLSWFVFGSDSDDSVRFGSFFFGGDLNCIDLVYLVDWLSFLMRTTGFWTMEIGAGVFVWRLPLFFCSLFTLCSLKWHYEVFRWFDQFVGDHLYKKDEAK